MAFWQALQLHVSQLSSLPLAGSLRITFNGHAVVCQVKLVKTAYLIAGKQLQNFILTINVNSSRIRQQEIHPQPGIVQLRARLETKNHGVFFGLLA
jgi:hypothetical protein